MLWSIILFKPGSEVNTFVLPSKIFRPSQRISEVGVCWLSRFDLMMNNNIPKPLKWTCRRNNIQSTYKAPSTSFKPMFQFYYLRYPITHIVNTRTYIFIIHSLRLYFKNTIMIICHSEAELNRYKYIDTVHRKFSRLHTLYLQLSWRSTSLRPLCLVSVQFNRPIKIILNLDHLLQWSGTKAL